LWKNANNIEELVVAAVSGDVWCHWVLGSVSEACSSNPEYEK
jgi:hypothetical protein